MRTWSKSWDLTAVCEWVFMQSITAGKQCNVIILDYNNSVEYNTGGKMSEGVNKINVFLYLLMQFSFTII